MLTVLILMAAMLSGCAAPNEEEHSDVSAAMPVPTATPVPLECAEGNYVLLEDGTAMITYTAADCSWTIPAQIDGHPVTGLGDRAVSHRCPDPFCFGVGVFIPDAVTRFNGAPFWGVNMVTVSADHPTLALIDHVLYSKGGKDAFALPGGAADG